MAMDGVTHAGFKMIYIDLFAISGKLWLKSIYDP